MFFTIYVMISMTSCVAERQNFLLIIIDDLRTALGSYGDLKAHTPNTNRLAKEGATFSQAFAQQALCAPSRNSFLTSRRPDTLQLYDFYSYWRTDVGNFTTLPQHLKNNGYITKSIGKVFHPGISSNNSDDSPYSWTETPFHPFTERYKDAPVCQTSFQTLPASNLVCPVKVSTMPNSTLPDIEILQEAKRFIKDQARNVNPFFLAVGFQKPHIPFKYPEKYLKYHPLHKFALPHPYKWPENVSSIAYNPWIDLRKRSDIDALNLKFPWEKIPESFGKLIIQSYYAAVTYIDDLIGKLINQLEILEIRQNTTIILMSDHGWSLGEHAVWAKYSNFDVALRVPLIISIPGLTFKRPGGTENRKYFKFEEIYQRHLKKCLSSRMKMKGDSKVTSRLNQLQYLGNTEIIRSCKKKSSETVSVNSLSEQNDIFKLENDQIIIDSLVELVDIFPTVADLANVAIPLCTKEKQEKKNVQASQDITNSTETETVCSEGITLVPLIRAALKKESLPWKKAAFGQYPRPSVQPSMHPSSDEPRFKEIKAMGYTVKTNRYRYTSWLPFGPKTETPDWNNIIAEELYDHEVDGTETQNLADYRKYIKIKKELKSLLQRGWRNALPKRFNF